MITASGGNAGLAVAYAAQTLEWSVLLRASSTGWVGRAAADVGSQWLAAVMIDLYFAKGTLGNRSAADGLFTVLST